jgi:hypothetical protein
MAVANRRPRLGVTAASATTPAKLAQSRHAKLARSRHAKLAQSQHAKLARSRHAKLAQSRHAKLARSRHAKLAQSQHAKPALAARPAKLAMVAARPAKLAMVAARPAKLVRDSVAEPSTNPLFPLLIPKPFRRPGSESCPVFFIQPKSKPRSDIPSDMLAPRTLRDEASPMLPPLRVRTPQTVSPSLGIVLLLAMVYLGSCRKILGNSERTSMSDVDTNLEQLIGVSVKGLDLQVSPRFLTFGPLPSATPWETPVSSTQSFVVQGQRVRFKTGSDGLVRERYEVRACPLREIWGCVELWATGKFANDGEVRCIGLRLEKGATIERRKLGIRNAASCPFMTAGPSTVR